MRLAFILCLLPLLSWSQPIQRQFWTTNTAPWTLLSAGTNAYVTYHLLGGQTNQYVIDVPTSFGQTNNTVLSAGTNVVIVTNTSGGVTVYTVSSVPGVQTNVTLLAAGTNVFVSSTTNNGVITYTIDVPTNAIPVQQTNWPWQSITNIATVQIPYAAITNPPSDIERTNWAITDITNSLNLTNWALLSTNTFTNVIVAAGSNVFVTPSVSGQLRTYTVDVPASSSGTVYASNVVSGGILPIGTVATNSPFPGSFLEGTTGTRYWSQDGSTLTNLTGTNINGNLNVILLGTITNLINSPQVVSTNFIGNGAGLTNISVGITGNASNQVAFVAWNGTAWVAANAADTVYWREEWWSETTAGERNWKTSASASAAAAQTASAVNHPGIIQLSAQTSGSSQYAFTAINDTGNNVISVPGGNAYTYMEWDVQNASTCLASVTNYIFTVGLNSFVNSATPANGWWFLYDGGNSDVWKCVVGVASSYTTNNTAVTATLNNWFKLAISIDTSSNAVFYINGTSVYTNSSGPTVYSNVDPEARVFSNANKGNAAVSGILNVDYCAWYQKLGTGR